MKNATELYISDLLAVYVGGNGLPVKLAAESLGVGESLVYQHRSRDGACPTSAQLLRYMDILPETFGNAVIRSANLTGAYRPTAIDGCLFQATLHGIQRASDARLCLSSAAEDGKIDHVERRSVPTHVLAATSYLNAMAFKYQETGA